MEKESAERQHEHGDDEEHFHPIARLGGGVREQHAIGDNHHCVHFIEHGRFVNGASELVLKCAQSLFEFIHSRGFEEVALGGEQFDDLLVLLHGVAEGFGNEPAPVFCHIFCPMP